MKIQVSLLAGALCVCAAAPSIQAQTLTATGPYVAVTDRNVYPKPPLPVLGPAGSTITDPVFQSSITRITDGATRPGYVNYSFRTPSSPHQNAWSARGSYFYVLSDDGTAIPFQFDPSTGTASRIAPTLTGNGGLVLTTYVDPQFSYVDDSIIYVAYSGSGTNLRMLDQYDFSTGVYTQLVNLDNLVSGLSGTYIGGIASSAGASERIETFFGGASQDHHHYVLVFDRANPSNRLLLDTWASTLNGQPTPITLNFSLHHVAIDRSGRYVMLYTSAADQSGTRQAPQSYVWDTQTGSFFAMTLAVHPYGHDALGYSASVNQDCCTTTTWDAAQWQFRSLSEPAATRDMLPTVLSPEEVYLSDHTTWNNASATALVPYISGTFRYGNNTTPWRALDDEIVAIESDAPGQNPTIWRFAHHRSNVASDLDATAVSFWYEPRPNVSDDGKWVLFTSNWEKTLGTDPKGDSATMARQDVFVVKLSSFVPVAISAASLPSARESVSYSAALQATGGSGAFVWTIATGALPSGLALNPSTGRISGVPATYGAFAFAVSVTDAAAAANTATAPYTITVTPPPVAIVTSALAGGRVTMPYAGVLQATGGSGGYVWSIVSGSVPAGLSLNGTTGAISGTPLAAATSTFNVNVTDAADPTNTALASLSIVISPSPIAAMTSGIASGQVTLPYAAILQATGGSGSYSWSISSGALPAGLSLNAATGAIAGTPQTAGTSAFTITVTDGTDATNSASMALSIGISKAGTPPPDWNDQDVGATGASGSAAYANGVFTVQGAGADVWGTSDALNYVYLPLAGDGTIVARVVSVSSEANWVKAGVMIRGSLDPSSAQAFMLVSHAKGVAFQRRTSAGNTSVSTAGSASTAPRWVKLVRTGSTISAYESPDGATWTLVGSDTFAMSSTALVGLAVSSHVTGTLATAQFDSVSTPLASGWAHSDIGSVPVPGSASSSGSLLSVTGSGADVWGSADAFHYVYRPLTGDGTIVARVVSIQNAGPWVKAGVMIRETLDANATQAFVLVSAAKGVAFQRRDATGGTSVSTAGSASTAPHWVKLTRSGATLTAYESTDGSTWTEVGSDTIPMAATVYVGLAVTSHSTSTAATGAFDNVSVR